jgi:hypothetical protein
MRRFEMYESGAAGPTSWSGPSSQPPHNHVVLHLYYHESTWKSMGLGQDKGEGGWRRRYLASDGDLPSDYDSASPLSLGVCDLEIAMAYARGEESY